MIKGLKRILYRDRNIIGQSWENENKMDTAIIARVPTPVWVAEP